MPILGGKNLSLLAMNECLKIVLYLLYLYMQCSLPHLLVVTLFKLILGCFETTFQFALQINFNLILIFKNV